jgi:hypothetical protein
MTSAAPAARRNPFLIKRGMRTMKAPRLISKGGKAISWKASVYMPATKARTEVMNKP